MALSRDARLLDRARRGDDAAFEQLHARHQPAILAFCRHLTGSREDAEDAVQHTFLAAYRRLAGSGEMAEWRPWLFTVARNRCLTLLRARRGEHLLVEPDVATAFDGLAIEVERRQELRDLVRDMGQLPEPQRAALVLSQLDALSYREIGAVLDVSAEKVKALVFQARASLASARDAREAPCLDIRQEIATARGPALRRRLLRRHVGQCDGCRDFEVAVMRQRAGLGILLPVAPSAGLGQSILGATLGREGATAASAGGAAVASGGAGGTLAGTLAALGASSALKLAVVVAVVGTSAGGALAADLPAKIEHASPWRAGADAEGGRRADGRAAVPGESVVSRPSPAGVRSPAPHDGARRDGQALSGSEGEGPGAAGAGAGREEVGGGGSAGGGEQGPAGDAPEELPPGLAKRDELPPGLAKRDELPPGLAKRDEPPPGQAGKAPKGPPSVGGPAKGDGGGSGNGGGQGQGPPAAGGLGGGSQGNGGGNAGGGANGNGAAQGNAGGQGNGNGSGNPH